MLDVSLRAGVLRLLAELRAERGLSLLYITHDLLSARVVTDEILVLNDGRIVERGATKDVLQHPNDAYTVQLLDAVANPFAASRPEERAPAVTRSTQSLSTRRRRRGSRRRARRPVSATVPYQCDALRTAPTGRGGDPVR